MSEEIKEILDKLRETADYPKLNYSSYDKSYNETIDNVAMIKSFACKQLLNYITNLQQKVEQLENKIKYAQKIEQEYSALLTENTELENIRKEAYEFTEWHYKDNKKFYKNEGIGLNYPECDALLNILDKGSDKE